MSRLRSPAALVLAASLIALTGCSDDGGGAPDPAAGGESEVVGEADEGIDGVMAVRVYYARPVHFDGDVDYEIRPAAGGMHHPVWANCGFYDEPVADEHIVHDLEHGAVWLAYSPGLAAADLEVIHDLARANKVVAAPYASLPAGTAVVATAWARQLTLDSVDDPRLERFVVQYQDGSQAPEAGASCTGSPIGEPLP